MSGIGLTLGRGTKVGLGAGFGGSLFCEGAGLFVFALGLPGAGGTRRDRGRNMGICCVLLCWRVQSNIVIVIYLRRGKDVEKLYNKLMLKSG